VSLNKEGGFSGFGKQKFAGLLFTVFSETLPIGQFARALLLFTGKHFLRDLLL
jgi:hypothetical protein